MSGVAVHLIDVNNLLYAGDYRFSKFSMQDTSGGFSVETDSEGADKKVVLTGRQYRTGGMFMVMNIFRGKYINPALDKFFFCFDRRSFRKDISKTYKANRPPMPAHLKSQSSELQHWLNKMGYNTLAVDGLEADDLIASLHTMLKDVEGIREIRIHSSDRDNAWMVDTKTSVVSHRTNVPDIDYVTYPMAAGKKGHLVRYNTSLIYKCLTGDGSDETPSIHREAYGLYNRLMNNLEKLGVPLDQIVDTEFSLIEPILEMLTPELCALAKENWAVIKPKIIPDLEIKQQVLDMDAISEFCEIFDMKSIAKSFNIQNLHYRKTVGAYRVNMIDKLIAMQQSGQFKDFSVTEESELEKAVQPEEGDAAARVDELNKIRDDIDASVEEYRKNNLQTEESPPRDEGFGVPSVDYIEPNSATTISEDANAVDG